MKVRRQCEALAPGTTYTEDHRCLKRINTVKVGSHWLCAHHRSVKNVLIWAAVSV